MRIKRIVSMVLCVSLAAGSVGNTAYAKSKDAEALKVANVSYDKMTLKKGKKFKLKASVNGKKKITYSSSNRKIAVVNGKGEISARKKGKCTITVSASGMKKKIRVTVGNPVSKITVDSAKVSVLEKGTKQIKVSVFPKNASDKSIAYQTSNKNVVSVSSTGKITGKKAGTCTVTAIAKDNSGKKAVCRVTVSKKASNADTSDTVYDKEGKEADKENASSLTTVKGEEQDFYSIDFANLELGYAEGDCASAVTQDITLPAKGTYGSEITWKSSVPDAVSAKGKVNRGNTAVNVLLTAHIKNGKREGDREFSVTVLKKKVNLKDIVDRNLEEVAELSGVEKEDLDAGYSDNGYVNEIDGKFSDIKITGPETAKDALNSVKTVMGVSDVEEEFRQNDTLMDGNGGNYSFKQMYNGYEVFDSAVTVSADKDGNADYLVSDYTPLSGNTNAEDVLAASNVVSSVQDTYDSKVTGYDKKMVVYADEGQARLAYHMYMEDTKKKEDSSEQYIASQYEILADAQTGQVVYANPVSTDADMKDLVVSGKDLTGSTRKFHLRKDGFRYGLFDMTRNFAVTRGNGDPDHPANPGGILWRKGTTGWSKEEVSAAANAKEAYSYFRDTFDWKSFDNNYSPFEVQVDTGIYNNACWNYKINAILLGRGTASSYKYRNNVSLGGACDLVAHEFTHGVVGAMTSLDAIYFGTPGTINEAYADIFGCLAEGSWKGTNNWKMGEDISKTDCIRNIANPEKMGNPSKVGGQYYINYRTNDWKNYKKNDRCGVHRNSTIISHAAYLMNSYGIRQGQLQKLWFKSLALGYKKESDFYDVRRNVLKAAELLNYDSRIIKKAFDEVGITKKSCHLSEEYFQKLKSVYKKVLEKEKGMAADEAVVYIDGYVMEATTDNELNLGYGYNAGNAKIDVYEFDPGTGQIGKEPIYNGKVKPDGQFSIPVDDTSAFMVEIRKEGYVTQRYYREGGIGDRNANTGIISLSLEGNNGTASGIIYDAEAETPVGNTKIQFYKGQENMGYTESVASATTASDGSYTVNLAPGVYTGVTEKDGFYKEHFRVKVVADGMIEEQNGYMVRKRNDGSVAVLISTGLNQEETKENKLYIRGNEKVLAKIKHPLYQVMRISPQELFSDNGKYGIYYKCDYSLMHNPSIADIYCDDNQYRIYNGQGYGRLWNIGTFNVSNGSFHQICLWQTEE